MVLPLYRDWSALYQTNNRDTCSSHCSHKEKGGLRISQCFPKLRPFPVIVRRNSLIISDSVSCDFSLAWSQPSSVGKIVGHKICENKCKHKAERTEEQEEDLPRGYWWVVYYWWLAGTVYGVSSILTWPKAVREDATEEISNLNTVRVYDLVWQNRMRIQYVLVSRRAKRRSWMLVPAESTSYSWQWRRLAL